MKLKAKDQQRFITDSINASAITLDLIDMSQLCSDLTHRWWSFCLCKLTDMVFSTVLEIFSPYVKVMPSIGAARSAICYPTPMQTL